MGSSKPKSKQQAPANKDANTLDIISTGADHWQGVRRRVDTPFGSMSEESCRPDMLEPLSQEEIRKRISKSKRKHRRSFEPEKWFLCRVFQWLIRQISSFVHGILNLFTSHTKDSKETTPKKAILIERKSRRCCEPKRWLLCRALLWVKDKVDPIIKIPRQAVGAVFVNFDYHNLVILICFIILVFFGCWTAIEGFVRIFKLVAAQEDCSIVYVTIPGPIITVSLVAATPSNPRQGTYYYSVISGSTRWLDSIAPPSRYGTSITSTASGGATWTSYQLSTSLEPVPGAPTSAITSLNSQIPTASSDVPPRIIYTYTLSGSTYVSTLTMGPQNPSSTTDPLPPLSTVTRSTALVTDLPSSLGLSSSILTTAQTVTSLLGGSHSLSITSLPLGPSSPYASSNTFQSLGTSLYSFPSPTTSELTRSSVGFTTSLARPSTKPPSLSASWFGETTVMVSSSAAGHMTIQTSTPASPFPPMGSTEGGLSSAPSWSNTITGGMTIQTSMLSSISSLVLPSTLSSEVGPPVTYSSSNGTSVVPTATSISRIPVFTGTTVYASSRAGSATQSVAGLMTQMIAYHGKEFELVFPSPNITTTISYWTGTYPTVRGPDQEPTSLNLTTRTARQTPFSVFPSIGFPRRAAVVLTTLSTAVARSAASPTIDRVSVAEVTSCGESGNFTLNFDDTSVGRQKDNILQVNGMGNPYHHLFYANGFTHVPDKWEPYPAISQPNIAMFLPLTGALLPNTPFAGTLLPGELGAGPRAPVDAYWFNAYSGYFGCALNGITPCTLRISGYRYDRTLKQEVVAAVQNVTLPACWGYIHCRLTQVFFNDEFRALSGIQFNAYTYNLGIPQIFMLDDLQMEWHNNSCSAGILRIGHHWGPP